MELQALADDLLSRGVSRIHTFAWRDLDDPEAGGSEVHADHVFRRWAATGLEITHRTSTAGREQKFSRNGYQVIQRSGRYSVFPSAIAHEIRNGRESRDAVIEIWNGVPWFSQLWSRTPRNVWLHHVHGPMWKQSLPPGFAQLGNLIESRIAPHFYKRTPVITLANSGRDELIHLGFKPNLVHVVNPGVDDLYSPNATTGITSKPSLVAVGRLAPVKRFPLLIETVERVRESIPDLVLNIVGDGPDRATLEALSANRPWVHLMGRLETADLINLYRKSWLLVSASIAEGWGMTITEAGACGTPAVVIDNSGHRDATINGVTGLVSDNPDDLARDIQRVLTDADLRGNLASGALKRSEQLRWDNTATATLSHLHAEVLRFKNSA